MLTWVLYAFMLLLQNASFTWVSRARNSKSIGYHAIAAVGSNLTYFLNLIIGINLINAALASGSYLRIGATAGFYTVFTVIGSIAMHHLLMKYIEKGKRKVGS